jgi:ketosteroid isomerase-like protein
MDPVELVASLFRRYAEGGLPAAMALADDDVLWAPHDLGEPLRGRDAILARGRALAAAGVRMEAIVHRLEDHDGCVVVAGRVRVLGPDGHYDVPMNWQVDVVDGKVSEVRAERRIEDARADCAA